MQSKSFPVATKAREEMVLITSSVEDALRAMNAGEGICMIYTPHTTAAVTINENADPDVAADLLNAFRAMVPKIRFAHAEGNSDAHLPPRSSAVPSRLPSKTAASSSGAGRGSSSWSWMVRGGGR